MDVATRGRADFARLLLDAGADPNVANALVRRESVCCVRVLFFWRAFAFRMVMNRSLAPAEVQYAAST